MMDRTEQIELLLDHYNNPRNHGELPDADVHVQGGQPGCSDIVTVYLKLDGDRIEKISFTGDGCTISQAATSMLTEIVTGMETDEVQALDHSVISDLLGEEVVQTRPKCATLGLDTIKAALREKRRRDIQGE